jgi:hypothetical protein
MKKTVTLKLGWVAILLLLIIFPPASGAVVDDSILTPEFKLTAEADASAKDQFGFSMAVNGNTMVVGAPYKDDACPHESSCNSGAVYLFKSDGNTWAPNDTTSKLTASDAVKGDQFGWSVAIDGERLAVGAPTKNGGAQQGLGAVYLFRHDGTTWVHDESQPKLTSPAPNMLERFGFSLALDGNRLVVGAPLSNSVYVFERQQDGKWGPVSLPPFPKASMFGSAVAARNGRVVVGAPGSGLAFVLDEGVWVKLPAEAPFLGCAVALHGDTVAVGAPFSMHPIAPADGTGSVYVFKLQGTTWVQEDVPELPYAWGFGSSVSINGNILLVGAPYDEVTHPFSKLVVDAGSVYVFCYENNKWILQSQLIAGDPSNPDNPDAEPFMDDRFGWAVATADSTLVAGAPFLNDAALPEDAGAVYGFVLTSDNNAPIAQAEFHPDEVLEGDLVTLDGSSSSDPENDPLTYTWLQRTIDHEPQVDLDLSDPEKPTFAAPELNPECTTLTFDLTVTDDKGNSSAPYTVEVPVRPNNTIYSTLGRKHHRWWHRWRPSSLLHSYEFKGGKDERVTINMEADASGWHRGNRATLILRDKIWGIRLWKKEGGRLPNTITATLPADGEYGVYVIRRPWFCRGRGFTGDYVLTVEGTCGKVMK